MAIEEAEKAISANEVPVGAVVIKNGVVIGRGSNTREKDNDISGHAEINALKEAAKNIGSWDLGGCDLYVTLEPCLMCAGAIKQSRIRKVVYGAKDAIEGAESKYHAFSIDNASTLIYFEESAKECENLLFDFFKKKRK